MKPYDDEATQRAHDDSEASRYAGTPDNALTLDDHTEHVSRLIREDGNTVMLAAFGALMAEVHKELATVDAGLDALMRELKGAIAISQEWHR